MTSRTWNGAWRLVLGASLLGLALPACSADTKPSVSSNPGSTGDDAGTGEDASLPPPCPEDNPYCAPPDEPVGGNCGNEAIDLAATGVNIMVAIDGAASMATHWPRIQAAVEKLRESHPNSAIGLQVFYGELVKGFEEGFGKANWCGDTQNNVLDVGDHAKETLSQFLGAAPPGPAFIQGLFETHPVIEPLNHYLTQATTLADPTKTNYLVFITSGNDNCFGSVFSKKDDKLLAYEKLAVELLKRNIRVLPIGFDASAKPGSDGTWGTANGNTDIDVLSTLLKHGGTGLKEVPKVDDPDKLAEVVSQVGQMVKNCRFTIPATLDPSANLNPFALDFTVNGTLVPRDRLEESGWNFVAGNTSEVELFGQSCQAVRADAKLEAKKTCSDNVCGTAAVKVETKPRAVLYLFDVSASRTQCIDGGLSCYFPPDSGLPRVNTYWEVVGHALGQSLVAPINDDIEFGLQFFPAKGATPLSCDVAAEPEISPASGTAITIMRQTLEKLPFGFSPVLQVLENVAKAPGRLAEPDVQGAVVMLSDGGDNCSGLTQEDLVTRFSTAATSLLDAGVETYVIRYGAVNGMTAAQEGQLRAIVENGGTARVDPNNPDLKPYIDAKSEKDLNDALAGLSNSLATCSFALEGLPEEADKEKANLYLNGEVIPFDSSKGKSEGWGFADEAQSLVELFGDSCVQFKTNRRTSVVLEFGCQPIVLF